MRDIFLFMVKTMCSTKLNFPALKYLIAPKFSTKYINNIYLKNNKIDKMFFVRQISTKGQHIDQHSRYLLHINIIFLFLVLSIFEQYKVQYLEGFSFCFAFVIRKFLNILAMVVLNKPLYQFCF